MTTTGSRSARARSMARVIASPTTTPMLPPMKPYSIAAATARRPSMKPMAETIASRCPVEAPARDEARLVRLRVGELQRVERSEVAVVLLELTVVEERPQPLVRREAEMVRALRTDLQIRREILVVDRLRATRTLYPQAFGNLARLVGRRLDWLAAFLEPRHWPKARVLQVTLWGT